MLYDTRYTDKNKYLVSIKSSFIFFGILNPKRNSVHKLTRRRPGGADGPTARPPGAGVKGLELEGKGLRASDLELEGKGRPPVGAVPCGLHGTRGTQTTEQRKQNRPDGRHRGGIGSLLCGGMGGPASGVGVRRSGGRLGGAGRQLAPRDLASSRVAARSCKRDGQRRTGEQKESER
jgi:hypothetical protein